MNISVAGTGYVGLVAGVCFAEKGHVVTCVDIDKNKVAMMEKGISPIYENGLEELMIKNHLEGRLHYTIDYSSAYKSAEAIFIGVGTPELPDGSADLSYIAAVTRQIAENIENDCLVVVKSTVPVGTNDKVEQLIKDYLVNDVKVEVASNPEFLAQGSAVKDTLEASRIIIGTNEKSAEQKLFDIYRPFNIPIISLSRRSAEMVKYASNDFLALKISYMNDLANLCELVNADIEDVAKGMSYDPRIGRDFLNAGIGYGGSCLPKDTKALNYLANQHGYRLKTVESAVDVNNIQKTRLIVKAKERMISFKDIKVAVLGLTFKAGTDDLRESPAIENIRCLLDLGADVQAYDPVGNEKCKMIFPEGRLYNGKITYVVSSEMALKEACVCFIFTRWSEIERIKPQEYVREMRIPIVYDGRNIYDVDEMSMYGVEYYSIGRA